MALLADRRDRAPAPLATVLLLAGDPARRRAVVARLRDAGLDIAPPRQTRPRSVSFLKLVSHRYATAAAGVARWTAS